MDDNVITLFGCEFLVRNIKTSDGILVKQKKTEIHDGEKCYVFQPRYKGILASFEVVKIL